MISAFGLGNSKILSLLKEVLNLSDSELSQRLSAASSAGGDEALLVQRIARLRGVLACFHVCNKQTKTLSNNRRHQLLLYQMELAAEAILGQRSAASLATGPVIPDPFISPLGFTITPALSINHPPKQESTLEVQEDSVLSSPALSLSDHNSGHD